MKITTKKDNLIVQLEGVERLWAFKSGLNLKKDDISTITWSEEKPHWRHMKAIRCPGTGVPKVFYAGNFISNRGLEFWYLQMQEPGFLVITTKNGTYKKVRLTTSQGVGLQLKRWLDENNKSVKRVAQKSKQKPVKQDYPKKTSKKASKVKKKAKK